MRDVLLPTITFAFLQLLNYGFDRKKMRYQR